MRDVGKNVESPKILQKETNGEGILFLIRVKKLRFHLSFSLPAHLPIDFHP
jgi:hypothetical protein